MKPFELFNENRPALFLAPLAGLTHSPFRRLLADFGGYSALYSEMLSGVALFGENFEKSTYIHRRPEEGRVVYQILINNDNPVEKIVEELVKKCDPFAIDLNLGCPAPSVRKQGKGAKLFTEYDEVERLIKRVHSVWSGPLSIKSRLGSKKMKNWEEHFFRMVDLFSEQNISWHTLHPRFAEDKMQRMLHNSFYKRVAERSSIPLIANGEILLPSQLESDNLKDVSGVMIGRAAVVKPWIFRELSDPSFDSNSIDFQEVWNRFYGYVNEEFIAPKAIGRIKQFTTYYGQNFKYGHNLYSSIINSKSLDDIYSKANRFLESEPERVKNLSILQL